MGGTGNGKWGGYVEASKPDFQPPLTEIEKGYVEDKEKGQGEAEFTHEIGNIFTGEKETERKKAWDKMMEEAFGKKKGEKQEWSPAEKERQKKEVEWKEKQRNTPEAIKERERRAEWKQKTYEQKVADTVNREVFDRITKKEFAKWEKGGGKDHQKEWVAGKLKELENWWAKGGKEEWMKKNPQLTQKITAKVRRKIRQ